MILDLHIQLQTSVPAGFECRALCRFLLHVVWAVGALYQDTADEAMQRSGQESSAVGGQIQRSLGEALNGMSIYELACPATQTLLADYKCLITSLKQDPLSSGSGAALAAGVLMLPDLLWKDGLHALSETLRSITPDTIPSQQASEGLAELVRPISLMRHSQLEQVAALRAFPGRNPDNLGRTRQPDNSARDLLMELGMAAEDATPCSSSLMQNAAAMSIVTAALRPSFRIQLEAYLHSEFGPDVQVRSQPKQLPPVAPCWGKFNASANETTDFLSASGHAGQICMEGREYCKPGQQGHWPADWGVVLHG